MRNILLLLLILSNEANAFDSRSASDIGVTALVVTGIAAQKTWEQRGIAAGSQALNFLVTNGLKELFSYVGLVASERPDGSDNKGMPSGHTSHSFTAAGNMCLAGPAWLCGVGLAGAAGVGYARVDANRHTWQQVGCGAGLGLVNGAVVPKIIFSHSF